jgi:hypothetical protein
MRLAEAVSNDELEVRRIKPTPAEVRQGHGSPAVVDFGRRLADKSRDVMVSG